MLVEVTSGRARGSCTLVCDEWTGSQKSTTGRRGETVGVKWGERKSDTGVERGFSLNTSRSPRPSVTDLWKKPQTRRDGSTITGGTVWGRGLEGSLRGPGVWVCSWILSQS